jgi:multiple sugar transport system ATP-binding protein
MTATNPEDTVQSEEGGTSSIDHVGSAADGESRSVELIDIRKTFDDGRIVACENINLEIDRDELVVLLGPSGCGKTTTLRIISGLETPDSGSVVIAGEDVTNKKPKDRDLAFVFQSIALYPHMNVRKNMQFGLDMKTDLPKEEKRERVDEAAAILGIGDLLDRKPAELSGGQQQRVSLGRAMVMEPAAFLLDEPFSALDANLRDTMRVEIKKLQRQLETAMVFVTHDQEEAMTLGDTIVILNDGHIQQASSPYDIYNEPANKFVADFIGSPSTNMIEGTVVRDAEEIRFESEFLSLPLGSRSGSDRLSDGQSVTIGVRPQYLNLNAGSSLFRADVTVIESHGSDDAIYLDVDGRSLTAEVDQGEVPKGTESVTVGIDPADVWVFDADGERLI